MRDKLENSNRSWQANMKVSTTVVPSFLPALQSILAAFFHNCWCLALSLEVLTHWGQVAHICVSKLTSSDSDNGLSPALRQAIAGMLLIGYLGTNFSGILIAINTIYFKKMHLKIPSAIWRPFCFGLKVLLQPWYWLCDVRTFASCMGVNRKNLCCLGDQKLYKMRKILSVFPEINQNVAGKHNEVDTKRPPFPDNIFKFIFLNENCCILMKISLKFDPHGPINNIAALVQIMA